MMFPRGNTSSYLAVSDSRVSCRPARQGKWKTLEDAEKHKGMGGLQGQNSSRGVRLLVRFEGLDIINCCCVKEHTILTAYKTSIAFEATVPRPFETRWARKTWTGYAVLIEDLPG